MGDTARLSWPSLSPWVFSDLCPLSQLCYLTIPSYPLPPPTPPAPTPSQYQGLFQWPLSFRSAEMSLLWSNLPRLFYHPSTSPLQGTTLPGVRHLSLHRMIFLFMICLSTVCSCLPTQSQILPCSSLWFQQLDEHLWHHDTLNNSF